MDNKRVGIIGLGLVGSALAKDLLKAGFEVYGFDILEEKIKRLEKIGIKGTSEPEEVASNAPRVILSLMSTAIVREVIFGKGGKNRGIIHSTPLPHVIIDTTTGDPVESAGIAQEISKLGVEYIDATISGSSKQIEDRKGVFLIGGREKVIESCTDIFSACSERYLHVGGVGDGQKFKLITNLILGLNRLVLAEGLVFARALRVDLEKLLEVIRFTPAYSCAVDIKGIKMIKKDFSTQSKISQHSKDLDIILRYAGKAGIQLPLTRLHKKVLELAINAGRGELDTSAVLLQLEEIGRDFKVILKTN